MCRVFLRHVVRSSSLRGSVEKHSDLVPRIRVGGMDFPGLDLPGANTHPQSRACQGIPLRRIVGSARARQPSQSQLHELAGVAGIVLRRLPDAVCRRRHNDRPSQLGLDLRGATRGAQPDSSFL